MSDAGPEEVTVSGEGITVRKSLNEEDFQTLAVVFEVRSDRDETARILLTDQVPDAVPIEDVGFHPEYGAEHWTVEDRSAVFEREFEPDEEFTTIFGIRDFESETADLLGTPDIEVIEDESADGEELEGIDLEEVGDLDLDDLVSEEDSEAVRDLIAGERDSLPGLDEDSASVDEVEAAPSLDESELEEPAEIETEETMEEPAGIEIDEDELPTDFDLGEEEKPIETAEAEEEEPTAEAATDTPPASEAATVTGNENDPIPESTAPLDESDDQEVTVPVTGGVARVLAKELREGKVSDSDRELLEEALVPGDGSTDARIEHLQNEVADLSAYTSALETFLDENGAAQELIDEFQAAIDRLETDLDGLDERVGTLDDDVGAVDQRVAGVEATVEEVNEAVGGIEDSLTEVEEAVAGVEATVDELADDVEDLEDDLDRVEDVADRTDEIDDRIASMRTRLDDLEQFRTRLSSLFGSGETEEDEDDAED